ncbi:hypothetical protein C7J88_08965 [Staphylococcus muscae]|uniref:Uncharacterized protein n=1 Tax=Staphylococcus muscae TaxID=1294 RepID=A0A240BWH8_9STAP|nr:hypothetical protein [Staphylococcus muscae]AVQ34285.1 hypothetical protein C7J88_08965 [Staphylococcus muscae]PNZ03864.1 hypothetical protein CD131_05455 [Staphylococcus muscae]GGA84553.1 hypothetical protein GCM10007183_05900 [Staphylococcus muscae]SNW00010.1 Uncharacterised protein [Staphylococcus muscae]
MRRTERSDIYPRVEKVLDDGTIIAYDKRNQLNTDLNIHTLTDQQQYDVFGGILIKNTAQQQPTQDYEYLRQKDIELQKTNRKNKWLLVVFVISLFVIALFLFESCTNDTNPELNSEEQNQATNEELLQQKDNELQQQIKETQDSIASNDAESQSKIDQLKQQIQELRNDIDSKKADQVANQYDDTVDNLQHAEDERQSGNLDKMQEQLDRVNTKLDEITKKISDWFNN